jgi:hypothetical protein
MKDYWLFIGRIKTVGSCKKYTNAIRTTVALTLIQNNMVASCVYPFMPSFTHQCDVCKSGKPPQFATTCPHTVCENRASTVESCEKTPVERRPNKWRTGGNLPAVCQDSHLAPAQWVTNECLVPQQPLRFRLIPIHRYHHRRGHQLYYSRSIHSSSFCYRRRCCCCRRHRPHQSLESSVCSIVSN